MTDAVRAAPAAVSRTDDGVCLKQADLSEAHALAKLVVKVAHALLCQDIPRVTGFVETDPGHVVSPARWVFCSTVLPTLNLLPSLRCAVYLYQVLVK